MTRKAGEIGNPDKTGVLVTRKKLTSDGRAAVSVPPLQTTHAFVRDDTGRAGMINSLRVLTIF